MTPLLSKRIDRLTSSLVREILAVAQRPEVISFAGGLPAADVMPTVDFSAAPVELRQYGPTEGEPVLREAVARHLTALGRPCKAEQVLITSGSQQGIDLVSKLFIDDGTPVLLESPSYLAAIQSFRIFGAKFVSVPLEDRGPDPAAFAAAAAARNPAFAYLIPNFQNPTGYCYSTETRSAIAAILDQRGLPLVEDEPYRDLAFEDGDRTPISGRLKKAPWIYLGSFSKTACPGLRVGYLACSPELFMPLLRLKQAADLHTNRLGQWWLARFLTGNDYEPHLTRVRAHYRVRRDAMEAALSRHFADLAQWSRPDGGLFFWTRLNHPMDTRLLLPTALAQNIAFMPGEPFFPDAPAQSGCLRLNFSHTGPDKIEQGIRILARVVREAARGPASP